METLNIAQLTSLGAGGMLAVAILWLVFSFLDKRRNGNEGRTQIMIEKSIMILEQQTKILHEITTEQSELRRYLVSKGV